MSKTSIMYSSHPIANYSIGRFQFTNTVLTLDNEKDQADFQKLHDSLPPAEKNRIKKIDVDAAEQFVKQVLSMQPKATQTIDSSMGGEATRSVGTGNLTDQLDGKPPETGSDDSLQSNTNYSNAGENAPATTSDFVPNRDIAANPGVITNQDAPTGSGDTTSGENHGAGNFDGANNLGVDELKQLAAGQGTQSNEDQAAALELLREAGVDKPEDSKNAGEEPESVIKESELSQERVNEKTGLTADGQDKSVADKPKLAGLNLNRKS